MSWSQTGPRSGNIKAALNNLLLHLHFTRLKTQTLHPWRTSSHSLKFKAFAVMFSTFFTCKAFILLKLVILNLIFHSSYSSPAVRSQDSEPSYFLIFRITSPSVWTTSTTSEWTTGKTSHSTNTDMFFCCTKCRKYPLHPTVRSGFSPLGCIVLHHPPMLPMWKKQPTKHQSRCSTASREHPTHSQTETACTKRIPYLQAQNQILTSILSQVQRYIMQSIVWVARMSVQLNRSTDSSNKWQCFIFKITKFNRRIIPKHCSLYLAQMNHKIGLMTLKRNPYIRQDS